MKIIFAIALTCFCITAVNADDEGILVDAKINGKPVQLLIDTGSSWPLFVYSKTAERLGIKYAAPQSMPGQDFPIGWTTPCIVDLGYFNLGREMSSFVNSPKIFIPVMETPSIAILPGEGIIGWGAMKTNSFSIDTITDKISFDVQELLRKGKWAKFKIETNLSVLALDIPLGKSATGIVVLDTGSIFGVSLNSKKWSEWKTTHTGQPSTFVHFVTLNIGDGLREELWANKLSLGSLILTDVPVMEANSNDKAMGFLPQMQYVGTLGRAALKRLDIIIDGKNGFVFVRPKTTSYLPYQHNRLGADFMPQDSRNDELIAHVIAGSPAYEAGIRDGDILLKEGVHDVTKWRTDTNPPPEIRFIEQPAGTKLELTLKRGDKVFQTTAILRNILPPDAPKNSN